MMVQTLTWQGAYVIADLGVSTPRIKSDEHGRLTDVATVDSISELTALLVDAATMPPAELRELALLVVSGLAIDTAHVINEL
jgi:hypothetical protein